ncbi:MAG: histidine kinase N-terminal 7TM domain-containing protein [Acetatifactor sp.]
MQMILSFVYILVIGAVLFSMAALLFRGREMVCNRIYFVCQGMVVLWCASQILLNCAHSPGELYVAYLIGNIGICFIGSFWFFFSETYTGKRLLGLKKWGPVALSVFFFLAVLTNPLHQLYYVQFSMEGVTHGPLFFANVAVTYLFTIMGSIILYRNVERQQRLARSLVAASVLLPVVLNALYLSGIIKASFDITPLGFAISIVLVLFATFKYRFIDLKRELAITNEKLLLEQERNRIAQQVHDTAGHTLTMIQSYLKLARIEAGKDNQETVKSYLEEAGTLTAKGIRELRESINMLRQETEYELVTQGVMQLANQVREIPVEVTVRGEDGNRYSHLSKVIYDTVRESVTNTLKYASASKMDIIVRFQETCVELVIADDGVGCEAVQDNNGLKGIRERIQSVGGTVQFVTSAGEGFMTRVKLPVKEKKR